MQHLNGEQLARKKQHLAIKIQNALPCLFSVCKKNFLDRFEHPKMDPNVGLYLLGKRKYF